MDEICAFIKDYSEKAIDTFVDSLIPSSQEETSLLDTGHYLETMLIKGAVKERSLTSLAHSQMEWKLARAYMAIQVEDLDTVDRATRTFNKEIREAAGEDYLGENPKTPPAE